MDCSCFIEKVFVFLLLFLLPAGCSTRQKVLSLPYFKRKEMAEVRKTTRTPKTVKAKPVDEYGHLQPQAPELEEAVLGALMIEKDAYSLVSEILRPESFLRASSSVDISGYYGVGTTPAAGGYSDRCRAVAQHR